MLVVVTGFVVLVGAAGLANADAEIGGKLDLTVFDEEAVLLGGGGNKIPPEPRPLCGFCLATPVDVSVFFYKFILKLRLAT